MNLIKIIGIILLLIIGLLVANAQTNNTVNFTYDAVGNRVQRTITVIHALAPTPNNNKDSITTIAEDIKGLIADSIKTAANAENTTALEFEIKVFPNPVQYKLNVQFTGTANAEGCKLQIYDGVGKLFYSQEALQNQTEVNMQVAKKGSYFMVVVTKDGKRLYWKLVKE